jgi:uncharacterized protein (TIRG00374 family)
MLNRLLRFFSRRVRVNLQTVTSLIDEFQDGASDLAGRGIPLVMIGLLTVLVWTFWVGSMWMSFLAVRYAIQAGNLVVGFAIGQIVGVLSMIPGGIGTLEGSSALAYTALGVPFETAITVLLVFRMTYYVVPFAVALPFYFSLKRRFQAVGEQEGENHGTNG